jgi:hypothetical protein
VEFINEKIKSSENWKASMKNWDIKNHQRKIEAFRHLMLV